MYRSSRQLFLAFFLLFSFICLNAQNIHIHDITHKENGKQPVAAMIDELKNAQFHFTPVQLFATATMIPNPIPHVKQWLVCQDRSHQLSNLYNSKFANITLALPTFDGIDLTMDLTQVELFAEGFNVHTSENEQVKYQSGLYYRGVLKNMTNSIVSISIFENQIFGMIHADNHNIAIQTSTIKSGEFIIYDDTHVDKDQPISCGATERMQIGNDTDHGKLSQRTAGDCVKVYIECDYALYQNKGSTTNVVNWITAVYNNVATLYANESINTTISEIFVWTTQDSYSKTNSVTALEQFKAARPTFNGNLAHLAALGGQNIGGVAWLDVLCSNYNYAYSNIYSSYNSVPTYSWTVEVMTHEMGHNLGSNHTQWCGWTGGAIDNCYTPEGNCSPGPPPTNGGTIMSYCHLTSYGINFNNGFGPKPGDKIRARVAAVTCLSNTCGSSCPTPTGLNATNIQNTSATLSWNASSGATSYKLEYKTAAGTTWTQITTSATTYNVTGLTAGTTYNSRVLAVCSSGNSAYSSTISFTTTGGTCNTPTGLNASAITSSSALVSWNAVSGVSSYNLQYKLSSSGTWSQVNTTSTAVQLNGLSPSTSYDVRVQSVCSGSTSAFSSIVSFTTSAASSYCPSKGTSSAEEWISRVKLNLVDRVSASDGGYYDATSLVADVVRGQTQTIYFRSGITGAPRNLYWTIWIDYNQNGSFTDVGEKVISGFTSSTNLLYSTFTPPTTAALGKTRMRVSMKEGTYSTSCEIFPRGEVEDYSVNIKATGTLPSKIESGESTLLFSDVSISPNPVSDLLIINYTSVDLDPLSIEIKDAFGKNISKQLTNTNFGFNQKQVDVSNLINGIYFITLQSKTIHATKQFIKL